MTKDDIIKLARDAGFNWPEIHTTTIEERLERFANLVAKHEREACAVIAETPISGEQDDITMQAKDRVAAAIRARNKS
jgi:hypothetical protein